jgi:cyanophycinase
MRSPITEFDGKIPEIDARCRALLALGTLLLVSSCQTATSWSGDGMSGAPRGAILAVGGGGTPASVVQRGLEEASRAGTGARVAVVPFASAREDRGLGAVEMWSAAGALSVALVPEDERARTLLEEANLIWLGGGSQQRLMESLERLDLVKLIRERHEAGAVVGGTSAGAAVLGGIMISGDPEPDAYTAGAMAPLRSLELIPGVIVDQHFRERRREGRLISALLDQPRGWFGLGISEATAAIFIDGAFEVMGEGVVLFFDTRQATIPAAVPGTLRSASGITLSVHAPGERHRLQATSGP